MAENRTFLLCVDIRLQGAQALLPVRFLQFSGRKKCSTKTKKAPSPRAPWESPKSTNLQLQLFLGLLLFRGLLHRSCRLRWWRRRRGLRPRHTFLKPAHAFTQSPHQLRNLASPKKHENDNRDNQQMHWAVPHRAPTFRAGSNEPARSYALQTTSHTLKYNTLIPGPARHTLPVQVFEQRNSVLPRNSR